jgi:tRNA pseudouridine38-40 synthase|tara:strand:- start:190 stop:954 length:765 start_codon:yes stop_codon:yes gene_type:complete
MGLFSEKRMQKYRSKVEYDGRHYVGWQRQDNGPSIQAAVEEAILNFCGEQVEVIAAGRTDSGVHALGMTTHFTLLNNNHDPATVRKAINFHLGSQPIKIIETEIVPDSFHARFSAIERRYLYRILNRQSPPTLDSGRVWHVPRKLDIAEMQEAAEMLIGEHDFSSFRAKDCQAASPIKTLNVIKVIKNGDEIHIIAHARSFLHRQIRNIVGSLKLVGEGKWDSDDIERILLAKNRTKAGPTAPAEGLYFLEVIY